MNKELVISILRASFARPQSTPDCGAEDRDAFLKKEQRNLLELVIEPKKITATTSEWARQYGVLRAVDYEMYAIAGTGEHWLLYDPETRLFSLAEGRLDDRLVLVGWASDDALAEWKG